LVKGRAFGSPLGRLLLEGNLRAMNFSIGLPPAIQEIYAIIGAMELAPWQLQIVKRSLKKKEKIDLIEKRIPVAPTDVLLDLGCAQGILSYFLRKKGGTWISTDLDFVNLKSSQALLGIRLVQMGEKALPFKSGAFDQVICLDYLEHVDDDDLTLAEIRRVLKERGTLILVTPHTGRLFLLQKLRPFVGLKMEFYGHKRDGYSRKTLEAKLLKAGLRPVKHRTYAKFFTELLELMLNAVYVNLLSKKPQANLRDGHIRPTTSEEFVSQRKAFKFYKIVYPVLWLISRLDKLLFFQRGNAIIVWAAKVKGRANGSPLAHD
jgi:2-polyprenyl-3-methyl-5-hydroxy-6-metoxy-1,4-benzoquinol methylase